MWCDAPIGASPIAGGTPGGSLVDEQYRVFLRDSKQRARFLIELNAVEFDGPLAKFSGVDTLGGVPIAHTQGAPAVLGERVFLFGDGKWIGRPADTLRANKLADARIIASADIERSIPISPDQPRRGEIAVGEITFANADGGLDHLLQDYSVSGRSVRIYLGASRADFAEFGLVQEAFGSHFEADRDTLRLRVQSTAGLLSTPLQSQRFRGTGGQDGDADLANRLLPITFGECFNITPVLINRDQWIYQVSDGPILAIDAVRERGLALTPAATPDVGTYGQLRATDVALGEYVTCLALGMVKVGFGVAGPEGPVTMDVRGEVASGTYTVAMGDILHGIATRRAALDGGLLNLNSFADLPRGKIGYYADGSADLACSDVFDALLASISGWYATSRSKLLKVGYASPPEDLDSWAYHFDENQILDFEEIGRDQAPRYSQGALYAKNWTPLAEDDISAAVSTSARERLVASGQYVRTIAGEVRMRDRAAVAGGDLETFFVNQADADDVVSRIMTMFRQSRRRFRLTTTRVGYLVDLQSKARISYDRHGLGAGANFTVIGVRDDSRRGRVELTLWG